MNLRQAIKALRRARKPIHWCDRRIRGKYGERAFASGTVSRGALSMITWCGVPFPSVRPSLEKPLFVPPSDVLKQKPIVLPLKSYLTRAVS